MAFGRGNPSDPYNYFPVGSTSRPPIVCHGAHPGLVEGDATPKTAKTVDFPSLGAKLLRTKLVKL
jgi:hypothetical protein